MSTETGQQTIGGERDVDDYIFDSSSIICDWLSQMESIDAGFNLLHGEKTVQASK